LSYSNLRDNIESKLNQNLTDMRKVLLLGLMLFLVNAVAFAQDRVITGTVTSTEDGQGVPGATVLVKGTTIGTATDIDGRYSISVPAGNNVLVFTFVGLRSQEVSIGNRSTINVALESDITALGEVIVTGYGTQPKREVTGAVSSVKGDAIQNLPLQSFDRALQGRAAGVQVRSSNGLPGGAVNIRIRGVGSINAGNEPLFIVDGVQLNNQSNAAFTQSNPLAFLNPNDIESMEILKDAASAAIYGSQAANGVVIITTKKGKQGKAKFEFNAFAGETQPMKYLDVLGGSEWYAMRRDALINSGNTAPEANSLNTMGRLPANWASLTRAQLDALGLALPTYDWQREVIGTGRLQNYELSVSGGDDKTTFFLSGSYNYQQASIRPIDFERGTVRLALTHKATDRLSIETNINLSTFQQNVPFAVEGSFLGNPAFSASAVLPHNNPYNEDGTYNLAIAGVLGQNIVQVNDYNSGIQRTNTVVGNLITNYKILDNLTFRSLFGLDYRLLQGDNYRDPRTPDGAGVVGRSSVQSDWRTRFITTQTLNWNKSYNGVHNLSAILGIEYLSETREGISGAGIGFPTFQFRTIQSAATPESVTGFWTGYRRASAFGSVNYDYKKKYLVTATARYDGSSRFGINNRYGWFPSIRVGWSLVEEEFLKSSSSVSEMKLRASYGLTGNDQIGNFAARGLYGGGGNYSGSAGILPSSLANFNLGWETNNTLNFGLDYGFFDNRVTGSLDVFDRRTKNLLLDQPILWINGFGSIANNVGELQNRGIEFEITTVNVDKNGFRWNTSFNFSKIDNQIVKLYDNLKFLPANPGIAIGQPVGRDGGGANFVALYAGVNPATGRPMWYDIKGNITYLPLAADRQYFGSNLATTFGGMNNTFSYKGFEFTAFFTYEYGGIITDGQYSFLRENGTRLALNALREVNDRSWRTPGQITDIPRNLTTNAGNETRGASRNSGSAALLKSDFIRLSQVTLAYNFKPSLISKIGLSRARVYMQGLNLWTYKDYPGYDPEFTGAGTGATPLTKNYTLGVQIGF
jgi:TonB-linked SusC/RagA family outer membrane protein